jgi:hypothetical protein
MKMFGCLWSFLYAFCVVGSAGTWSGVAVMDIAAGGSGGSARLRVCGVVCEEKLAGRIMGVHSGGQGVVVVIWGNLWVDSLESTESDAGRSGDHAWVNAREREAEMREVFVMEAGKSVPLSNMR